MSAILASSSFPHETADYNAVVHMDQFALDPTFVIFLSSPGLCGGSVTIAVEIEGNADAGAHATGLGDLYYNRIWIIPKHTDLGNITANQVRTVELWNAHFESKTLTGFTVDGDVTVDGFASGVLAALESTLYEVAVPLAGAPVLSATITFAFEDAEAPEFEATIVGRRVIPFTLRHNWADPVLEQISFKTDVIGAQSGKEQRIGLRPIPRRRMEMSYLTLTPQERTYVENLLYGWQGRPYAVPLWSDKTKLRSDASTGTTTFDVDTRTRDFEPGGLVFITDGANYDTLEIESVTDDSITTVTGSLFDYALGAKIAPTRIAILDAKFNLARITNHAESMRLAWQLQADEISTTRRETYTPVLYRGVEVYNVGNDYSQDVSIDQELKLDIIDNELGIFQQFQNDPYPRRTIPFNNLITREELPAFLEWVYNRKGQLKPFWFVERTPVFYLQADATADDDNLVVKGYSYHDLTFGSAARRDIAIKTSAGWKYRRITGSHIDAFGVETITLDSSLGVAMTAASNPLMSYLKYVRLASDTVELSYESTDAIHTATSFIDLLTNN